MIFELTSSDWSGNRTAQFIHPNPDKTGAEFDRDVEAMIRQVGNEYLTDCEAEATWASVSDWLYVVGQRLPQLGYMPYSAHEFHISDFGNIDGENEDSCEARWKGIVGEELYDRAVRATKAAEIAFRNNLHGDGEHPA